MVSAACKERSEPRLEASERGGVPKCPMGESLSWELARRSASVCGSEGGTTWQRGPGVSLKGAR
jgi:hypothetical protein